MKSLFAYFKFWYLRQVMHPLGTYVLQDQNTSTYQNSCHTTGATYFDYSLGEAELFSKEQVLHEMTLTERRVWPVRLASPTDRTIIPLEQGLYKERG